MKKLNLMFILVLLLFLVMGTVSAIDSNSTDIVQADSENEPISITNESQEISICDNDNLSSSFSDEKLEVSESGKVNAIDDTPSKSNLTVVVSSHKVKQGHNYNMYLKDLQGHAVAGKKLVLTYNGKNYIKTTAKDGKFSIPINRAKSSVSLKISFGGDNKYNAFSQTVKVKIQRTITMNIGNSKLLTKGYLRIYLHGKLKLISKKKIQVKIGAKSFTVKTDAEGNAVFKPKVGPKKYLVTASYDDYTVSKKIKCYRGNVKNPLKRYIPTVNGVPDVDQMPKNFIMGYNKAQYTLKSSHYFEVMDRDTYSLYLFGKLSKYTFFKTKPAPKTYHILKRNKWNVIEREIFTQVVKKNRYDYWPKTITVDIEGKSYTYSEVRDIQNEEYTCGPTSASVCTQVLKNFHSEKYFQLEAHVTNGINIPDLKNVLERNKCSAYYFYDDSSFYSAIRQLYDGAALIAYLPNHYVAIIDVSPDGNKVLVSNSYGSYNYGSKNIPTNWVSVKKLKSNFAGIGLVVKPKYDLSKNVKKEIKRCFYNMGGEWKRHNVKERIPDIGR